MLRGGLIAIFGLLLIGAVSATLVGGAPLFGPLFILALILGGIVFERYRYKRLSAQRPDARYVANSEKFVDPETGAPVTVYTDPETGDRRYIVDAAINTDSGRA